jgi:hypothetical protein
MGVMQSCVNKRRSCFGLADEDVEGALRRIEISKSESTRN